MLLEKLEIHMQNNFFQSYWITEQPYTEIFSKQILVLNAGVKIIKPLIESTGKNLNVLRLGKDLFEGTK